MWAREGLLISLNIDIESITNAVRAFQYLYSTWMQMVATSLHLILKQSAYLIVHQHRARFNKKQWIMLQSTL